MVDAKQLVSSSVKIYYSITWFVTQAQCSNCGTCSKFMQKQSGMNPMTPTGFQSMLPNYKNTLEIPQFLICSQK